MKTKIKILDSYSPEDIAMLQALYSRSPASVDDHRKKLEQQGSGSFMDRYYIGYGHKSIGDCGSTTFFIEGVTMLCAKAIQDWPLYSGQESSTRYMDFSKAEFANPVGSLLGEHIQEEWRAFYLGAREPVREHLLKKYPCMPGEDSKVYERAIKARMFDILRAFLPAGAATNLSWHTNLRQAADHLKWLLYHPDPAVAEVAIGLLTTARDVYPASFNDPDVVRPGEREYRNAVMQDFYFLKAPLGSGPASVHLQYLGYEEENDALNGRDCKLLDKRPRGMELPWFFAAKGLIESSFFLDFGSFRDLQRHRAGTVRMPLLTTQWGFHPWYLDELPFDLAVEAKKLLKCQETDIAALGCSPAVAQSYIAMGYRVPCEVAQPLPAFIYRLELRSGKSVHPTLRAVVLEEARRFQQLFPKVELHIDDDPDSWSVRRGHQTIEEKAP